MTSNQNYPNVENYKLKLQQFKLLDYILLGSILLLSIVIGSYFVFQKKGTKKRKDENIELEKLHNLIETSAERHYLVGNRQMKELPVAMSLIASYVSGISFIGLSTEIYMYGILYAYTIPTIILGGLVGWYIFLPVFCDLQLTSIYEYFEMRFDRKIRLFGSFVDFIGIVFWMPMVIYVPGIVMNQFTDVNIRLVSGTICAVCVFYTCLGGISAVVWTDFFQSFIMFSSIILVMTKGILKVGGIEEIIQSNYNGQRIELPEITLDPTVRYSLFAIITGGTVSWTESTCCNQVTMQRFLSVSSVSRARKVLLYFIVGISILLCVCNFNGLVLYAYYHNCDPLTTKLAVIKDQILPVFVMEVFYGIPGLNGLFIGGILAAVLSTLSTGLNSLAAIFLEDFVKTSYGKPLSEHQTRVILKSIVVIFGVVSFLLVFLIEGLGTIFQLSRTLAAICGGPLFSLFLIGVLMPWINSKSALAGCSSSFLIMSWICIRAQYLSINENQYYKPMSVTECPYNFGVDNNGTNTSTLVNDIESNEVIDAPISYLWYTPLGALITIAIANCTVLIFGYNSKKYWKKKLIARFLWKYVPDEIDTEDKHSAE